MKGIKTEMSGITEHRDNIKLSLRLMMSAKMVTHGNSVADVGCDHAHTGIYLIKEGISPFVVAMDVRKGPLTHADANIRLYGYEDRITTRLSDGLDALEKGETDSVIIAGMGGTLTVMILEKGLIKAKAAKELILQPQSDIGMVRKFLRENGFIITDEDMCKEDGKFYNSIKAVPVGMLMPDETGAVNRVDESRDLQEVYDEFGEILLKAGNPVLKEYLLIMKGKTERVLKKIRAGGSSGSHEKKEFFEKYLKIIEKAMNPGLWEI